jgi:hypothetical protein
MDQFAFVALYNLALSTHVSALDNSRTRRSLQKAVDRWELLYSLQWREGLNLLRAHALIILTNLGHVRGILGIEADRKVCYPHIILITEDEELQRQRSIQTFLCVFCLQNAQFRCCCRSIASTNVQSEAELQLLY